MRVHVCRTFLCIRMRVCVCLYECEYERGVHAREKERERERREDMEHENGMFWREKCEEKKNDFLRRVREGDTKIVQSENRQEREKGEGREIEQWKMSKFPVEMMSPSFNARTHAI